MTMPQPDEEAIFHAAWEISDPERRREYVREACQEDEILIGRIEAMLAVADRPDHLLDRSPVELLAGSDTQPAATERDDAPLDFLTPSDTPGSLGLLGHYEILEVIGHGGMGIVLRAFDDKLHRVVAIKVMAAALAATSPPRKRFLREARAAAQVRHEHVVDIHAVEDQPIPYLVMEYVSGETLQQKLDRVGPLETAAVLRLGQQIARGLAAAHAQGLIHRDIKPSNILLEQGADERVKITDFGLARAADDVSLTQSGMIAGTPMYMAPEQTLGEAIDHRADLFSLGSVLYTMCSGRPPFRATTSMATLKRVADDQPRPIREIIPEVPPWLCDIIATLHAKKPEERFQSAKEVADLLGQCIQHLEHPTSAPMPAIVVPLSPVGSPAGSEGRTALPSPLEDERLGVRGRSRRRLAVAAAVLLCLVGGLSFTEATGVTELRATVMRIFTPDGTLVVETDDPAVKVTVEGDGGLVITGAGLEEIRLRPGSYRVQADRDGKPVPLDRNLVEVARGGREIVKVKLEAPPSAVAKAEKGAFVVLGGKGIEVGKFETLAEAVQGASDGDTIEVRGNGPFVTEPIIINSALTIRAGEGFWPVLKQNPKSVRGHASLLATEAPLIMEGLELQRVAEDRNEEDPWHNLLRASRSLYVANCRFLMKNTASCIGTDSPCELRNCEFLCSGGGVTVSSGNLQSGQRLLFDNCLLTYPFGIACGDTVPKDAFVQLTRTTFLTHPWLFGFQLLHTAPVVKDTDQSMKLLRVEASGNVFDASAVFIFGQDQAEEILPPSNAESFLARRLGWQGTRNLYGIDGPYINLRIGVGEQSHRQPANPIKSLPDWRRFWGTTEADSIEGRVRYQGGNILARLETAPERLSPEDFRLRPDSPGYRAGPDGKDLGADVDLVGPGEAYERWKQTPEYQQWLKDTGQRTTEQAPKPEPQAFVVLTNKGDEVRKFDTLAEAVQAATTGDTIEIRDNGPFVSEPIKLRQTALTIRAAAGFRPVIKLKLESVAENKALLSTNAALVLEGLELHQPRTPKQSSGVEIDGAVLRAANCRFRCAVYARLAPSCAFRNCEFLAVQGDYGGVHRPGARVSFDNCLLWSEWGAVGLHHWGSVPQDVRIRIDRSTVVRCHSALWMGLFPPSSTDNNPPTPASFRAEVSASVFDCPALLTFVQKSDDKSPALHPDLAEAALLRLLEWHGQGNVFAAGASSLRWEGQSTHSPTSLEEWKQFWGGAESDSLEGTVRFQGGSLRSRTEESLDELTPDDFRLRTDSAGYRAGEGGKDLGADVDLVGPGAAYERWKKTPEYQQWLKETGQLRAEAPKPEPKAFVVLTGEGVEVRKFDTLAEAVQGASDGDVIEIRGKGPFVTQVLHFGKRALVIRAGVGFRPIIKAEEVASDTPLLQTDAPLVLEGIELQACAAAAPTYLLGSGAPVYAANCRFIRKGMIGSVVFHSSSTVRNCEFVIPHSAVLWLPRPGARLVMDNNLITSAGALELRNHTPDLDNISVQFTRNSISADGWFSFCLLRDPGLRPESDQDQKPIRLELAGNVFHAAATGWLTYSDKPLTAEEVQALVLQQFAVREQNNLYSGATPFMGFRTDVAAPDQELPRFKTFADFQRAWESQDSDSVQGTVRFRGGDVLGKRLDAPEQVTPDDFRLHPDSAGYRAGPDGKDLGADVDMVGPGEAYERWKKTPEYQQWLKETGQVQTP